MCGAPVTPPPSVCVGRVFVGIMGKQHKKVELSQDQCACRARHPPGRAPPSSLRTHSQVPARGPAQAVWQLLLRPRLHEGWRHGGHAVPVVHVVRCAHGHRPVPGGADLLPQVSGAEPKSLTLQQADKGPSAWFRRTDCEMCGVTCNRKVVPMPGQAKRGRGGFFESIMQG